MIVGRGHKRKTEFFFCSLRWRWCPLLNTIGGGLESRSFSSRLFSLNPLWLLFCSLVSLSYPKAKVLPFPAPTENRTSFSNSAPWYSLSLNYVASWLFTPGNTNSALPGSAHPPDSCVTRSDCCLLWSAQISPSNKAFKSAHRCFSLVLFIPFLCFIFLHRAYNHIK